MTVVEDSALRAGFRKMQIMKRAPARIREVQPKAMVNASRVVSEINLLEPTKTRNEST